MQVQEIAFEQWCDELDRIAHVEHGFKDEKVTVECGREHFRAAYESGETPSQAFIDWMED